MTRIDTKTAPRTQGTTSSEGSRNAKQAENAPTLDDLDSGMSLAAEDTLSLQSDGESFRAQVSGVDAAPSPFEGMTPLAETPAFQEIGALEQACALEVQGHAYDLQSLASEVGGDDGVCLAKASDALMTSVAQAGEATPGSALPVLAGGVTEASEHVKAVSDEKARESGEGILARAWSGAVSFKDRIVGGVRSMKDPAPGETVELGLGASASLGVVGGEGKETLSLARERNADGSGGGYVVTREKSVSGSLGLDGAVGAEAEVGSAELSAKAEASASEKLEGSIKVERRYKSKEEADAHVDGVLLDKASALAKVAVGGPAAAFSAAVEDLAGLDVMTASSVTATGSAGVELAASLNLEASAANGIGAEASAVAQGSAKAAVSLKVDLDKGKPKRAELTTTRQLEATAQASLLAGLGDVAAGLKDVKGGTASLSLSDKRVTTFDEQGNAKRAGREISVTLELMADGKKVKGEITVPPGPDAEAIGALLDDGNIAGAMARMKDAGATLKLEGAQRRELPLGISLQVGGGIEGRAHYARERSAVLGETSGKAGDLLDKAWSDGTRALTSGKELERQIASHKMVG